jgi:hypothetical protein
MVERLAVRTFPVTPGHGGGMLQRVGEMG